MIDVEGVDIEFEVIFAPFSLLIENKTDGFQARVDVTCACFRDELGIVHDEIAPRLGIFGRGLMGKISNERKYREKKRKEVKR